MTELERILNQLNLQNDSRFHGVLQFLQSSEGKSLSQGISSQTESRIAQAAQAAGRGDQAAARQAIQEILRTPEGAALAARLRSVLGQSFSEGR